MGKEKKKKEEIMEFKEVYKKGLKTGKTITNGVYELKFVNNELEVQTIDKSNPPSMIGILLDTFEDNWEIIREE
ncbi:hypothetical protein Megpolyxen_01439 [Candidatus Megaera polyxenophila]|nr:hypothetical protein Megpolyxen_01439 [Candidatus Megaera polyxenophila]